MHKEKKGKKRYDVQFVRKKYLYIELDYGAMHNTDHLRAMNHFCILKL
jgi:hypothetical protein